MPFKQTSGSLPVLAAKDRGPEILGGLVNVGLVSCSRTSCLLEPLCGGCSGVGGVGTGGATVCLNSMSYYIKIKNQSDRNRKKKQPPHTHTHSHSYIHTVLISYSRCRTTANHLASQRCLFVFNAHTLPTVGSEPLRSNTTGNASSIQQVGSVVLIRVFTAMILSINEV